MINRLVLHAGTPKTGTTSLQRYLCEHRVRLLAKGILYPETTMAPDDKPKHQWIVEALLQNAREYFDEKIQEALAEAHDDTHTLLLSTEGIFNHWWDLSPSARGILAALSDRFSVSVWVWFRDPVSFVRSYYIQMLENPRTEIYCYGRDLSISDILDDPWFTKHLDYIGFVDEVNDLLGARSVVPFTYRGDTVQAFMTALGVEWGESTRLYAHDSMGAPGVKFLRTLNRYALGEAKKRAAVDFIARIDALLGGAANPLELCPGIIDRIRSITSDSIHALQDRFGLSFPSVPEKGVESNRLQTIND